MMCALLERRRISFDNGAVEALRTGVSRDDEVAHMAVHDLRLECLVTIKDYKAA